MESVARQPVTPVSLPRGAHILAPVHPPGHFLIMGALTDAIPCTAPRRRALGIAKAVNPTEVHRIRTKLKAAGDD